MKQRKYACLAAPAAALILEILPYGAVCNFGQPMQDGTIGRIRCLYSYFDLLPLGYANAAPFLTAMLTCVILALLIVSCVTGNQRLLPAVRVLLRIAVVVSLCPLLLGIRYYSVVGALITALLAAELLLLRRKK